MKNAGNLLDLAHEWNDLAKQLREQAKGAIHEQTAQVMLAKAEALEKCAGELYDAYLFRHAT